MKLASYRTFIEQSCLVKSSELRNTRRLRFSFFTSDVIHASAQQAARFAAFNQLSLGVFPSEA